MPATPREVTFEDVLPMDLGPDALPVYSIEDMGKLPPPRWLIKNFLEDKGMTLVYGREKTGKSTMVLNVLMAWLTQAEAGAFDDEQRFRFEDDPTKHSILYLLLEGQNTVYYRAKAWAEAHDAELPENLHVMGQSLSLFNKRVAVEDPKTWTPDMIKLWHTIKELKPTVVVVDTFSRANPNLPENDPAVAAFVGFLDHLRDEFGVAFIVVHHAPKAAGTNEPRGHSSLPGAATTLIYMERNDPEDDKQGITMWVGRQRNGVDLGDLPYDLIFAPAEFKPGEYPIEVAYFTTGDPADRPGSPTDKVLKLIGDQEVQVAALKDEVSSAYKVVSKLIEEGVLVETVARPRTVKRVKKGE